MRITTALALLVTSLPGLTAAAGRVSTAIEADTLIVTGDDFGNALRIEDGDVVGTWRLVATDGTNIDGSTAIELPAMRRLRVAMRGGPDDLTLGRLTVRGRITVTGGDGNDELRFRSLRTRGALTVSGGRGADLIDLYERTRVRGAVRLLTGVGDDEVILDRVRIDGSTIVVTSEGRDDVWVLNTDARRTSTFRVVTGDGRDRVTLEDSDFGDDVRVRLGEDDDDLWIAHTDFDDDLAVDGGDDDDGLNIGRWVDVDGRFDANAFENWW